MRITLLCTVILNLAGVNFAQAATSKLDCSFNMVCSPTHGCKSETFSLQYIFDGNANTAIIVGNSGTSQVEYHAGFEGISFVEKLFSGAIMTTTIANNGDAVHSRHTMISGLVPSQYFGECQVEDSQ